jgi:hypothetical protein
MKRREKPCENLFSDLGGTREYEMFSCGDLSGQFFNSSALLERAFARASGAPANPDIDEGFGSQDAEGRSAD